MNTFIKLMITYFIEQQIGVAHEAAAKAVEQLDMSYALSKFQHELDIAKSMKTGMAVATVDGTVEEIKKLCEQFTIETGKVEQLAANLKQFIVESLKSENVAIR